MYKFGLIFEAFVFVMLTSSEPNIVIFQNTAVSEVTVSSLVEVTKGANLSLTCRVIDTESGKRFNGRVIWSRKRKKSRFSNVGDVVLMELNNIPDANLSFVNVSTKDRGRYLCASLKYKLLKVVNLIVRPAFSAEKKETRTSDLSYSTGKQKLSSDPVPRVVRDAEVVPRPYNNYNQDFPTFTFTYPPIPEFTIRNTWQDDYDKWLSDGYRNKNYDDVNNRDNLNTHDSMLKFFYMMFGGVILFLAIYVLIKCCHDNDNVTPSPRNPSTPRNRRGNCYRPSTNIVRNHRRNNRPLRTRNVCSHLVCIQNRSTHPLAACLVEADSHTLMRGGSEGNLRSNHLDLPPTYADSTANSAASSMLSLHDTDDGFSARILNSSNNDICALPPTYEEALSNTVNANSNGDGGGCHTDDRGGGSSTHDSGGGGDSGNIGGAGGDSGDTGGGGGDSGDTGGGGGDSGDTGGGGGND